MSKKLPQRIRTLHSAAPLTDVHVHPSLKAHLFRRNLWRHYRSGSSFNPFSSRSDFKMLSDGGVGVIWASHYVPETQLFDDCRLLRIAASLVVKDYTKIRSGPRFEQLLRMMARFEAELSRKPERTELAKSVADIARIRSDGKIAAVHSVEGVHSLDGNVDNLNVLAEKGVAVITLSHFYKNDAFEHLMGVPDDNFIRKACKLKFETNWGPPPVTAYGHEILARMKQLRIIADVTHLTPAARARVYAEYNRSRPIVATHVGVRHLNPDPYTLAEDEMREIAATGGGIGIIFMNYWLSARRFDGHAPGDGIELIWETIEQIRRATGSYDHIMIGTDFDGFTDPPDDLRDSSEIWRLTDLLLKRNVSEDNIRKILGGNAMSVLQRGWR